MWIASLSAQHVSFRAKLEGILPELADHMSQSIPSSSLHVCLPFLITVMTMLFEWSWWRYNRATGKKTESIDASPFFYKMQPLSVVLFLLFVCLTSAYYQRTISANGSFVGRDNYTISVCNGGLRGTWAWPDLCPEKTFAIGFSIKVKICAVSNNILFIGSSWFKKLQNVNVFFADCCIRWRSMVDHSVMILHSTGSAYTVQEVD